MNRLIYIFIAFTICCGSINAQSIPKIEKITIYTPNLNIVDSLFLKGLDSLIFNSGSPDVIESKAKIFNVYCKIDDKHNDVYKLTISLDNIVQIYPQEKFRGCFDYNGYLFLWYYDIPPKLLSVSDKKKKLTYTKGVYIASDLVEFIFNYSPNKLELIDVCYY